MLKYLNLLILIIIVLSILIWWNFAYLTGLSIASDFNKKGLGYEENRNDNDHGITPSQLRTLFKNTILNYKSKPDIYLIEDVYTYTSLLAVWQKNKKHYCVRIYLGNDSKGVYWWVGKNQYSKIKDYTYTLLVKNWESRYPF